MANVVWTAMSGTHVQFYRPGVCPHPLSYGKNMLFPVANIEAVAKRVVRNLDHIGRALLVKNSHAIRNLYRIGA